MDHELGHDLDHDPAHDPDRELAATDAEWFDAEASLDDCDGYVVVAVDPQTGEVDAHGPYPGIGAVHAAEDMRATFEREQLADVVVRIVRWHTPRARYAA